MEFPPYATEPEAKTLIDKLAVFVARNGREFEKMTKQKQRDNPRFAFLFGGKYCSYYQNRVSAEIKKLRQQRNSSDGDHPQPNGQQQQEYAAAPQQPGGYAATPPQQQPGGYAAPQQQPGGYTAPPQQQPGGYAAPPQQTGGYAAPPQQSSDYPVPQQQQPVGYVDRHQQLQQQQQQQSAYGGPQQYQQGATYGEAQQQEYGQQPPQQTGAFGTTARAAPQSYFVPQQEAAAPAGHYNPAGNHGVAGGDGAAAGAAQMALGPQHELAALSRQTGLSVEQLSGVLEPLVAEGAAQVASDGGATTDRQTVLLAAYLLKRVRAGGPLAQQVAAAREDAVSAPSGVPAAPQQEAVTQDLTSDAAPAATEAGTPATTGDQAASSDFSQSQAEPTASAASERTSTTEDGPPQAKRSRVESNSATDDPAAASDPALCVSSAPAEATSSAATSTSTKSGVIKKEAQLSEIAQLQRTVKDPDALFALSVAEALKSLPMEQKVSLRIKIMEAVSSSRDTASRPPPVKTPPKAQAAVAALARAVMSAQKSNAEPVKAQLPPGVDVSRPPPSMSGTDDPEAAKAQPQGVGTDEFSEEFFIGDAPKDPEPDLPLAPPVKTQRVSRSAPFEDQIEDAKARAAAIARLAANEPTQPAGQGQAGPPQPSYQQQQLQQAQQTGFGYGPQPGAPAGPGNTAAPPHWWQQAAAGVQAQPGGYQGGPNAAPGAGPNQCPNPAVLPQQQQQQYQPNQPTGQLPPSLMQPLQMPYAANNHNNNPMVPQPGAQDPGLQLGLGMNMDQIQEKIQLLQQLAALQERQQGQQQQSLEQLQMQAVAMGGVPKSRNWDQTAEQQLQQLQQQAQQEMPPSEGSGLPMPSAAMPQPRDPQRGGPERRYRSPQRRFRR